MEQAFQSIKPGLTLYGVLVTLAVFAFAVGRFFWTFEKNFRSENIEKLKNLIHSFRRVHIMPEFRRHLSSATDEAYRVALFGLRDSLYPKSEGVSNPISRTLLQEDLLKLELSDDKINSRVRDLQALTSREVEKYLDSRSGNDFFDELDRSYDRRVQLSQSYSKAWVACQTSSYSFFALSAVLLTGLLRLFGELPPFLVFIWAVASLELFIFGVYSCGKMEFNRRHLLKKWEEMELHGEV